MTIEQIRFERFFRELLRQLHLEGYRSISRVAGRTYYVRGYSVHRAFVAITAAQPSTRAIAA